MFLREHASEFLPLDNEGSELCFLTSIVERYIFPILCPHMVSWYHRGCWLSQNMTRYRPSSNHDTQYTLELYWHASLSSYDSPRHFIIRVLHEENTSPFVELNVGNKRIEKLNLMCFYCKKYNIFCYIFKFEISVE